MCTGVSQMNSMIAETLSQNQTLHGYVAYNWSYGHFCEIFFAYFDENLVAMATPLDVAVKNIFLNLPTTKRPL